MRYPVVWGAVAFGKGLWLTQEGYFPGYALALLLFLVAITGSLALRRLLMFGHIALILMFLGCGLLYAQLRPGATQGDPLFFHAVHNATATYTLEGTVFQSPLILPGSTYQRVHLRVDTVIINNVPVTLRGKTALRWSDPAGPLYSGERIRVTGRLMPLLGPVNFGIGGIEDFLRTQGIHTAMNIRGDEVTRINNAFYSPHYWASRLRYFQADIFSKTLPGHVQPFIRTVWLGDRGDIPQEQYETFLKTGTAHILAVSGIHVGIVYISVRIVLAMFIRSQKKQAVLVALAVILFALIAGARISSLRAAWMICLYLTAELFNREPHAPTTLSLAGTGFLMYNPALLYDTAFLLSFSSVASLILFGERFLNYLPETWPNSLRSALATVLGVQVLPLPFAAHFFYVLPVMGPVANLIVVPLLTCILWLCPLIVVSGSIYIPLGMLFGHAILPLVWVMETTTQLIGMLPGAYRFIPGPTALGAITYWAASACLYKVLYRGEKI